MNYVRGCLTVASKDLRSELRSKEVLNASLSFAMVVLLLLSFAFDPSSEQAHEFSGGLLWLVYAFAGVLTLNRSFSRELPNDCLDALLASPLPASALYLGKCVANFTLLIAVELACLPVFALFYNIDVTKKLLNLFLIMALATWALTAVGTMFSALTVNLRLRELMLPTLVYPIMIPALMGAIQLTTEAIAGQPLLGESFIWFKLLVGFDIIFTSLSVTLVETVLVG